MAFEPDVIQAICDYMNNDPMESNLTIVQGITGDRSVAKVDLVSFDEDGADFRAFATDGATREVRIPWQRRISERPEVRQQLFALLDQATDAFGKA
ncbi:DUF2470 domain-containing protein [Microbacterium hominis]|uniref:DUF2470 domain-containing protein n=1 Tax=Microbacterium hominis TaxID=162426 RepID=A0A7D4PWI9_9MICO|nr:DUF2470 domain-containing protein [Microbacterium hominis]QKJ20534.1 DUF2470 domain-containing protein [Microbacterium hominis]